MIRISWTCADFDIDWADTSIILTKGGSSYTCEIASNANGAGCLISQTGDSDTKWELDEIIYIKENGADVCTASCDLDIQINHDGQQLSGTNNVTVA